MAGRGISWDVIKTLRKLNTIKSQAVYIRIHLHVHIQQIGLLENYSSRILIL